MRTVLVTGSAGFVGGYVMQALRAALQPDETLIGVVRDGQPSQGSWTTIVLDLTNERAVGDAIDALRPTHVLHLAAVTSVPGAGAEPGEAWRVNLGGSMNLAAALARHCPASVFLHASTAEVYGRSFLAGTPLDEAAPLQPANVYARSKVATEAMLADVLPETVRLILARSFNHTGPGQDERFVVPSFADQIARLELAPEGAPRVMEVGDLSNARDFLDVADVVDAYVELLLRADHLPARSTFNISSGTARRIGDILDMLRAMSTVTFEVRVADERLRRSPIPVAFGSSEALRAAIGWKPRVEWSDTVRAVLDAARAKARVGEPA
jgi:GDP-4-dehydro-6-deoxy-D-mannose reductase